MRRLSDVSLRWKLIISHGLLLLLVIGLSIAAYRTVQANTDAQQAVGETLGTISLADETRAALTDMETGYRGFLLVGREEFLEPYTDGIDIVRSDLSELEARADDPTQRERWRAIATMADLWRTDVVEPRIALRRQSPPGAAPSAELIALINAGEGKQQFDQIRALFAQAVAAEERRLAERTSSAVAANMRLTTSLMVYSALAVVIGVAATVLLTRDLTGAANRLATVAGRIADGELGLRVGLRRRDELGRSAAAFDRMASRLQATIVGLERSELELRRQQAELERSNRELQDFASVASHDLQEPLRKVQAFGERVVSRYADNLPPEGRDYLMRMQAAASRMQSLINDLLAFSRVSSQAQPFVPVQLAEIGQQVVSDLEYRIQQTHGTVTLGHLATIEADPLQMRQLLQNLIANGLKFRRVDVEPHVEVWSEPGDGLAAIQLYVRDNGIGFDEKYLDRIFTIFQRLHSRDEYEGTGIGLAVCRKIVERHGGTITAHSSPGDGTTFITTLPMTHGSGAATPDTSASVLQEVA